MTTKNGKRFIFSVQLLVTERIEVEASDHAAARAKAVAAASKLTAEQWHKLTTDALSYREPDVEFEETIS